MKLRGAWKCGSTYCFLESAKLPDGKRPEDVPGPSCASRGIIEVVDSQEQIEEGGSRKQVAQMENGTQRDLTEQEEQEMLENELMEEIAAEEMRNEEQRMWSDFHAADLRTWEAWAAGTEDFMQGKRKRARVQVLVQGQGRRAKTNQQQIITVNKHRRNRVQGKWPEPCQSQASTRMTCGTRWTCQWPRT